MRRSILDLPRSQDAPLPPSPSDPADSSRLRRYVVVGVWNTAFGYSVYVVLMAAATALGGSYLATILPAHLLGTVMSWWTQRRFVFPDRRGGFASFVRFNVAYAGVLVLQFSLLPLGVEGFGLSPWLAEIGVLCVLVVLNYFVGYFYTFRVQKA